MAHANNPSSNKQDKARMGPNAHRGEAAAGRASTAKDAHGADGRSRAGQTGARSSGTEQVSEVMTRDVCIVSPDQTLREAATMMADADIGSLPVGENDRLIGMITDRDIEIGRASCRERV